MAVQPPFLEDRLLFFFHLNRGVLGAFATVVSLAGTALPHVAFAAAMDDGMNENGKPYFDNGFAKLADAAPDLVGQPVENEHPGDIDESTMQHTTTGTLYWAGPGKMPVWTDGWARAAFIPERGLVHWEGLELSPPLPPAPVASVSDYSSGWPIGGAMGQRIFCIEGIESRHGVAMYNPTPVWNGEHARGYLGFLGSTANVWGAVIGNRASEWSAASRMIAAGQGSQFAGILLGRC